MQLPRVTVLLLDKQTKIELRSSGSGKTRRLALGGTAHRAVRGPVTGLGEVPSNIRGNWKMGIAPKPQHTRAPKDEVLKALSRRPTPGGATADTHSLSTIY